MKGEFQKFKEIPRGKRLRHFLAYYKWKALLFVVAGCSAAYVLYGMLQPPPEVKILWLSDSYSLQAEFDVRDWLETLEWDLDGDARISHTLTYIDFDRPYSELGSSAKSELTVLVVAQDFSFFMVNGLAMEWMKEHGILGTWGDMGVTGAAAEEYLAVPVTSLAGFSSKDIHVFDGVYVCVMPKSEQVGVHKDQEGQTRALRELLRTSGVLE